MAAPRLSGMAGFAAVWVGQMLSMLSTAMTHFALMFWVYGQTGQATPLSLMAIFAFGPTVLFSPLAGVLVDRWNRKLVMALSDLGAGLATVAILALHATGQLQIWHLYVAAAFASAFQAFQWPAYSAAITTMVPKEQYGRVNGLFAVAESGAQILAPLLAPALLAMPGMGIQAILALDIVTFVLAIGALLVVRIPPPARTEAGRAGSGSIWKESGYGFRYILTRPSLLGLQLILFGSNLMHGLVGPLMGAMILARTANNAVVLGTAMSIGAFGGLAGGLLMSAWGGPRRKVYGFLTGFILGGLVGEVLLGVGQGLALWAAGLFFGPFFAAIINACNQSVWQAKVAPDVQGRVFATRRLIAQISAPLGTLVGGPLADRLLEPAMMPGGALADTFGWLVGTGPGAGMGLLFVIAGVISAACGLAGFFIPAVRKAESMLPDHDLGTPVAAQA